MKPKKIVQFKITDYEKLEDIQILMELSRYIGKMESTKEPNSIDDFEGVFGIFLNLRFLLNEINKRFDIDLSSKGSVSSSLDDLLNKNGINKAK